MMSSYFSNIYEMIEFFGILLLVFLLGCIISFAIVAYLFHKYLDFSSILYKKSISSFRKAQFGNLLQNNMNFSSSKSVDLVESCRFLNVLLAFIFKEWRDTVAVHKWIVKKINVEMNELLETKAAKRLLRSIMIHDVHLGANSPVIHGVSIRDPCSFSGADLPDRVVVDIDMEYGGGFQLSVDVDLLFGKSAFVSIRVKHLKGQVRLQLNRKPCTHWSVSFVHEPLIDIKIDTNFLSRPLPQLGSLILNQVYRTIRRKHTFPNHKIRYTPFNAFWIDHCQGMKGNDITTNRGRIDVTISSCSRLLLPRGLETRKEGSPCRVVFATVALNQLSCEMMESDQTEQKETKKNNFLLTSNALSEVESFNKQYSNPGTQPNTGEPIGNQGSIGNEEPVSNEDEIPTEPSAGESNVVPEADREEEKLDLNEDVAPEDSPRPGTSYMMVTRNFSAVLSEETHGESNSAARVHVGSIVWNKAAKMKPSISEGDRILSINGHMIHSLGQAIAVINKIRAQKTRFYFKVQRKRRRSRGASAGTESRIGGSFRSRGNSNPFPHSPMPPPFSDGDSSGNDDDTESDFTDLDTDEHDSYVNEEQGRSSRNNNPPISAATPSLSGQPASEELANDVTLAQSVDLEAETAPSSDGRTSLCDASQSEFSWPNERFSLDVEQAHRYLNVRFWFEEIYMTSPSKKGDLTLVGVVAVPLQCIQQLCALMTSSTVTLRFKVTSPFSADSELRRNAERLFKQKTGFKLDHCYGDVTLTICAQA